MYESASLTRPRPESVQKNRPRSPTTSKRWAAQRTGSRVPEPTPGRAPRRRGPRVRGRTRFPRGRAHRGCEQGGWRVRAQRMGRRASPSRSQGAPRAQTPCHGRSAERQGRRPAEGRHEATRRPARPVARDAPAAAVAQSAHSIRAQFRGCARIEADGKEPRGGTDAGRAASHRAKAGRPPRARRG